jgi:hypothetical protein
MRAESRRRSWRRRLVGGGALLSVAFAGGGPGCAPPFDPPSKLSSLRLLAVTADKPYANPGDTVHFAITLEDALSTERSRNVEIVWFAGCFDPPGDAYYACYPQITGLLTAAGGKPPAGLFGIGRTFDLTLPEDIISRRPLPKAGPHYGIGYVFFAACAGKLQPIAPQGSGSAGSFPFGCFDDQGNPLGAESFVPGYTQVYSFEDGRANKNPIASAITLKEQGALGEAHPLASDDEGSPAGSGGSGGNGAGGTSATSGGASGASPYDHVSRCALGEQDLGASGCDKSGASCTVYELDVTVDPSVGEVDPDATSSDGSPLFESVWVDYYVDGGDLASGIKLLNDPVTGFVSDRSVAWYAPATPGRVTVWAVVHDSRGGTSVLRRFVVVD